MKSSSTRRVLKSVVGPALGATLGALVAGGCAKEEAKPAPTTTTTQPDAAVAAPTPVPPPDPAAAPPTPVEPEPPAAAPDAGPAKKAPAKKKEGAKAPPPAGVEPKKEEPKKSPTTEWYAGTMLERDIRPMRPARRGTDTTISALMTGLHDPALRPLT